MSGEIKTTQEILQKFGIEELNSMQKSAAVSIIPNSDTVLLSPTGTGKTLAFLLPLVEMLDPEVKEVQAMIVVPSRELALQIEQVFREMGSGFKANAVYGGRSIAKDRIELEHLPALLIGTPGRLADHLRREAFSTSEIKTLILDEFDKSLEVGFKDEMMEIVFGLRNVVTRVLTSATQGVSIPNFVGIENQTTINYLDQKLDQLKIEIVNSPSKDKLETLYNLLKHLGNEPGIVFCNFKDSIKRVSDFLSEKGIAHGCFFGGMEQKDRERALIKFRNGTHKLLLATDLAARGIDVNEIKFIIHYHLPVKSEEFTHRNGRTARMNANGTAYVLKWNREDLPDFIKALNLKELTLGEEEKSSKSETVAMTTLFVSGGRKDKISKSDIAGLFFKQGGLVGNELGVIEIKHDCTFVSVASAKAEKVIEELNNRRLKKKKVRVTKV
jgi:superfamily II DNA/RNA helicase